ncbi:MAG: glycosyltransferase [Proteobacteria bacterium]|nr:glycosyltransferase [Pseudomonadota bacterium]
MQKLISIIIPNYNGAQTIGNCIEAAFASDYQNFEIVVVDDCSDDDSVSVIRNYPCKLFELKQRSGASTARNTGARESSGDILFFIDADCLLEKNALSLAAKSLEENGPGTIIGGTYTELPFDNGFFSTFQSVFIHYSEVKHLHNPDYVATHALIMDAGEFMKSGGFPEEFMPILEDVEYSHRMRRGGYRLLMQPDILVRHVFNFSLGKSLRNAIRKSLYWTAYSLKNKDLFHDSGTASVELKANVFSCALGIILLLLSFALQDAAYLFVLVLVVIVNMYVSRNLFAAFFRNMGFSSCLLAIVYYSSLYAFAVGLGVSAGFMKYFAGDQN